MQALAGVIGSVLVFVALVFLIQPTIIYCLWDDTFVKFLGVQDVTFTDSVWISLICSALFKGNYSGSSKE